MDFQLKHAYPKTKVACNCRPSTPMQAPPKPTPAPPRAVRKPPHLPTEILRRIIEECINTIIDQTLDLSTTNVMPVELQAAELITTIFNLSRVSLAFNDIVADILESSAKRLFAESIRYNTAIAADIKQMETNPRLVAEIVRGYQRRSITKEISWFLRLAIERLEKEKAQDRVRAMALEARKLVKVLEDAQRKD